MGAGTEKKVSLVDFEVGCTDCDDSGEVVSSLGIFVSFHDLLVDSRSTVHR